jgi:FAD binding domain
MDAHNLAWKLALVASGHSPEELLDSYGQERGPVAADVLALTHNLVKLGTMTHPVQRALRNTIVPIAGRLTPIQRRAVRRISHTSVAYPSSPLTHPGRRRHGLQPGERAPDLEVTGNEGKTRLYEVLRHGRHVLLISGPAPGGDLQPKMRPWQDQIDVVTQANSRADRPGLGPAENVYLLRPDGYVAVRGSVTRPDSLIDYLHRLFGTTARQPAPASAPPA